MPRRPASLRLLLWGVVAALAASACGTGPPDHVRIGVVAPLTGPRAFLGQELVQGAQLAVDDLNQAGGLLGAPVELVVEDDGDLVALPGQLADLAERSRVSAVVGPEAPAILLGPRSPLSRRNVPAVLASAFGGDLPSSATTLVRTVPGARAQARSLGTWLVGQRGIEGVSVLIADDVEGPLVEDDLRVGFDDAGVDVAAIRTADPTATQLAPALSALRRDAPDVRAVLLWGSPAVVARATLGVRQLDWDVQIAVPAAAFVSEYRTLTRGASEGVVLPFPFDDAWFSTDLLTWMLRYHREHGLSSLPELDTLVLDVPVVAVAAYDAVGLIATAVSDAGTREPAEVAAALTRVEHEGVLRTYAPTAGESWSADDLYVARFHHLAVTYDVDERAGPRAGVSLWNAQVNAEYVPSSLLQGPGGAILQRLIEQRLASRPTYSPPRSGPGPVSTPDGVAT